MTLPGWVNDPAQFIQLVHSISGKRNNEDLKREFASLRAEIDRLRPKPEAKPQFVTGAVIKQVERSKVKPGELTVSQPPAQRQPEPAEGQVSLLEMEARELLTQLASLSQLTQIKEKLAKEEFEGKLDPRTLSATDSLKWLDFIEGLPHKPWITAYFINDGPNSVKIGINHPELERQEIKLNETLTIKQEHAEERIRRLFYKCDTGETASVRVVGQY